MSNVSHYWLSPALTGSRRLSRQMCNVQVLGEVQRALDPLGVGRVAPLGFLELYSEQVAASGT